MNVRFTEVAWGEYLHWVRNEIAMLEKVSALIEDARRSPFAGLGKPEPLRGNLSGWWSRRVTGQHRLIYRIAGSRPDQYIEVAGCRYHYDRD